ncbi:MAG: 4Fe-4S binding protein [Desulfobacterota bacterium]|nr:4Fe-4S binding protein [Thermodesulfobacteriota bacterium]MDW8002332.1 4Fe-4S binding protein [Deltaproteobacteria bacterium]
MKGKRIENGDLIKTLDVYLKETRGILFAFDVENKNYKTKMFKELPKDIRFLNPIFYVNSSIYLRRVFSESIKIVAILRPCETRAYVELTKLSQIESRSVICGSFDCFGTVSSKKEDFSFPYDPRELKVFLESSGLVRYACQVCGHKEGIFGDFGLRYDKEWNLWFIPYTERGRVLFDLIPSEETEIPFELEVKEKKDETTFKTSLSEFRKDFERCIMCLNCKNMCPVCFCVDCLFNTLEYLPKGDELINTILRCGNTELPKNVEIYHFIRMYHVSQTCVGCGSCEEACPQSIPLTKYFKGISGRLQGIFDYLPGKNFDEKIPYTTFKEDELPYAED